MNFASDRRTWPVLAATRRVAVALALTYLALWWGTGQPLVPGARSVAHAQVPTLQTMIEESGFCAYYKARYGLDLDSVLPKFTPTPYYARNQYVLGVYAADPMWQFQLYADRSGWILACGAGHPLRDPVSRSFNVGAEKEVVSPERLDNAVKAVSAAGARIDNPEISYYDFDFPEAETILAFGFGMVKFSVTIPHEVALFEASFRNNGHTGTVSCINRYTYLDGEKLIGTPEGCPTFGALDAQRLADRRPHEFEGGYINTVVFEINGYLAKPREVRSYPHTLRCPQGLVECPWEKVYLPTAWRR